VEAFMQKILLTGALLAGFVAAASLAPSSANAMTISTPAAAAKAVADQGAVEQVRYVCRRVWTRWGWRRSCSWRPNRVYGGYYGYGYRPYAYYGYGRPYYRRYWW
jgi:hypothetical protein